MKKRLLGMFLCLLMATTLFTGCGKEEVHNWKESSDSTAVDTETNNTNEDTDETTQKEDNTKTKELGLELVADNGDGFTYYRDRVTDGLFVCRKETEYASGYGVGLSITPVPDPETGKQITYTRYLELYNAQQ